MRSFIIVVFAWVVCLFAVDASQAAKLVVTVDGDANSITQLGAFRRWDADGNPTKPVNPNAKIDQPEVDATATKLGNRRWVFNNLEPGTYDLVIMTNDKTRIEGWHYPPVLEFDPFFGPNAPVKDSVKKFIEDDIKKSKHYENKVRPLAMGGDDQVVRVLVSLLRDKATSYKEGLGTLRFEVWQYTEKYGAWTKEKRTRVLHRLILPVAELRQWKWLWDPKLGQIEVGGAGKTLEYHLPNARERVTMVQ